MNEIFSAHQKFIIPHTLLLLRSYYHWFQRDLIPLGCNPADNARHLFESSCVVLSGGIETDQILNYGNAAALKLWAMDWKTFTSTPSRQTAEPMHQAARAAFLEEVRRNGFVQNYEGIRISAKGERFHIENATIWNLVQDDGSYAGQAATFSSWRYLSVTGN